jgi:nicotinamidase-related amidase
MSGCPRLTFHKGSTVFKHKTSEMTLAHAQSALVLTDMQNDFLSPKGGAYSLLEKSLAEHDTVRNLEKLLSAAKRYKLPVLISPHYYYPHDHRWVVPLTPLEDLAHQIGLVGRRDPLSLDAFADSGADFPARYKPYICDGDTIVASPHKVYGASTNDLILQLRRRRIEKIVLAGPVGTLCVEAHMRDFVEHGFEVAMVRDATAGATNDEGDGYRAAITNWRFMAHALWTTEQAVAAIKKAATAGHEALVPAA